ncbi:Dehydrogenase patE [Hyphodiscus hymeniophilus]|uniref:Dehydrogenase patE n=1 Tax=Hyphodiscus hymeniophilus TaxID=353542 RepID=A0A9P6VK20_9HELO|nr:Dehydrogenase patE [Hyphodiscus hymeniophilus]
MSTFDYIIVGGGTAGDSPSHNGLPSYIHANSSSHTGLVLASRLSAALPECTFLVIEEGSDGDPRIEAAQGYHQGMDRTIEWDHYTVPQKGLNGKVVGQAQGKIIGGSSAINMQGWVRGPSVDFDQWAVKVGDVRWSWAGLLPYFKKSEAFFPTLDQKAGDVSIAHGFEGPIKVSHSTNSGIPRNYPLRDTIARAYESIGVSKILDHNAGEVLGYTDVQMSTYKGKRYWSSSYTFGDKVTTWTKSSAEKVLFEGKKATSVQILRRLADGSSERVIVTARNEILVTSGVQGSAKLLLLSGIGPLDELNKHVIHQICDLPVGENYSDHPVFHTFWKLRDRGLTMGDMPLISPECDFTAGTPGDWMAWHQHNEVVNNTGKGVIDDSSVGWLLAEGKAHTESFSLYGHFDLSGAGVANPGGSCIVLASLLMTPTSRGTLTLRSADPKDAPFLDPNLLGNDVDRDLLIAGGRVIMSMMHGPVGQKIGAQEYGIDEALQCNTSDDAMMARILKTGRTGAHGSGTCAMGSVVDAECRVKGIDGLRVVDASVFPFPIAGHYQAAVYAIAEQVS